MGVYNQYRWRATAQAEGQLPNTAATGDAAPTWADSEDDTWQDEISRPVPPSRIASGSREYRSGQGATDDQSAKPVR